MRWGLAAGTAWAVPMAGSRGCQGDLEALGAAGGQSGPRRGHCSPGQTQKPAKGLVLTQHPESSPPHSKRKGQCHAHLNTHEQGCACMTMHTSAPQPLNTLLP